MGWIPDLLDVSSIVGRLAFLAPYLPGFHGPIGSNGVTLALQVVADGRSGTAPITAPEHPWIPWAAEHAGVDMALISSCHSNTARACGCRQTSRHRPTFCHPRVPSPLSNGRRRLVAEDLAHNTQTTARLTYRRSSRYAVDGAMRILQEYRGHTRVAAALLASLTAAATGARAPSLDEARVRASSWSDSCDRALSRLGIDRRPARA
jgi:hypothetical protein